MYVGRVCAAATETGLADTRPVADGLCRAASPPASGRGGAARGGGHGNVGKALVEPLLSAEDGDGDGVPRATGVGTEAGTEAGAEAASARGGGRGAEYVASAYGPTYAAVLTGVHASVMWLITSVPPTGGELAADHAACRVLPLHTRRTTPCHATPRHATPRHATASAACREQPCILVLRTTARYASHIDKLHNQPVCG